jgi:hypothetical protein
MAYAALVFFVVVVVLIFFLSKGGKNGDTEPEQVREPEVAERFLLGRFVQGFSGQAPVAVVSCAVTADDFVVRKGTGGDEIGRIARDSITNITVKKQSEAECFLELSWNFADAPQKAIFSFYDKKLAGSMADQAQKTLFKWSVVKSLIAEPNDAERMRLCPELNGGCEK